MLDLNPDPDVPPYALKRGIGDVVAVTAFLKDGKFTLGVLLDEQHQLQSFKQYDVSRLKLYRIPIPKDSPSIDFIDEHTPFLFLGRPYGLLDFVLALLSFLPLIQRGQSGDPLPIKVLLTVQAMPSSSSRQRADLAPTWTTLRSVSGSEYHWTGVNVNLADTAC